MRVALGIVTYNNPLAQIQQLLNSISLCSAVLKEKAELVIFVVDNGEDSSAHFQNWQDNYKDQGFSIVSLTSQGNVGFGAGMNRLMETAFNEHNCSYFICVNPDGVFHRLAIERMLETQAQFGPCLVEARQFPEEHPKQYDPESFDTPWTSGACLMIPAQIYAQIGGFDDRFFMYMEDVDLSWRARCANFPTKLCHDAYFGHQVIGRKPSGKIEKMIFVSARALAAKWHAKAFQQWVEEQMLERKFFESREQMPALINNFSVPDNASSVVNFEHHFTFSQARWE